MLKIIPMSIIIIIKFYQFILKGLVVVEKHIMDY